jgi:D-alanyl-D-alanine carboxypeptidase/D-alanyl-D-alanine-endopeptidase (penicillin-binding protein 4)
MGDFDRLWVAGVATRFGIAGTCALLALGLPRTAASQQGDGNESSATPLGSTEAAADAILVKGKLHFTSPGSEESLAADLSAMLRAKVKSGDWGAMVVSLSRGDTLFSHDAGRKLLPASTMKLYTSALAFERLGPRYRFSTDVYREGAIATDGTLRGNLVLRGGGDPAFSSRFIPGDPNAPMLALAKEVASTGIRHVTGDVIGDDGAFEAKAVPDGWLGRYLQASYAARVSALSLNENLLHVVIAAGKGVTPGAISLQPATSAYSVLNSTRTVQGSAGARLTVGRTANGDISVRGWIGSRSDPRVYVVVVDDPARFATGAFVRALTAVGISVDGDMRVGPTPDDAVRVATLESPPLSELASIMNHESINHFAELIFRNVARQGDPDGVGSATMGNALLRDFLLLRVGASPEDVFAADGSGLSILDRVTARSEVQLLSYANRAPWSQQFHESLPVAGGGGRDETLRARMRATPAQGNLHAKTGTTNDVVALSGYVAARDGEILAFSFLYNGKDRWNARETIDAMGATLASFARQ